jgi:hypothetical protein
MKGLLEEFSLDGGVGSNEPVRGKPYEAEFEEVHTRYSPLQLARAYGNQWRDSRGSVRIDAFKPDPANLARHIKVTSIFDATTYSGYLGLPDLGLEHTFQLPHSATEMEAILASQPQPSATVPGPAVVPAEQPQQLEMLGERIIEGLSCTGVRSIDEASGLVSEHWFSKDLILGVVNIRRDPEGEIVFRLFNLKLCEPDPDLFLRPEDP